MTLSNQTEASASEKIKWPEIFSLAGLNAAVVLSWIAYHEYQPVLLKKFDLNELAQFLVITKALVLVLIPPLAGYVADLILKKNGKAFTIFTVGVAATAMTFMIVASIIQAGPLSALKPFLPYMIVLWLTAMNLFISPANSMLESFAPAKKLPIVMGVLFLITEVLYGLEPLVVDMVRFFGDTTTFVVGGVLIAGTGIIFHRVSSNEVARKKTVLMDQEVKSAVSFKTYLIILLIGLNLGLGKALLVEFFPKYIQKHFAEHGGNAPLLAAALLIYSAILGFLLSRTVSKMNLVKVILSSVVVLYLGLAVLLTSPGFNLFVAGAFVVASGFSLINISGLPYALNKLTVRHVTYGVGIFYGASEIFSGLFEIY
ncbi:MAG: hypothetical protein AAFX87_26935 [Bacteroidota bacterium]